MFEFFRRYNKIVLALLFLLIIPSFVLFGVERYTHGGSNGEEVATVDGQPITRPDWEAQHRRESDRIRAQMPSIDPSLLDSEAARYRTLEQMVRARVLATAAAKQNLSVSEQQLARVFSQDTALASFRDANGKFDSERFSQSTGQSPQQYEASVRAQMSTQQVLLGVSGTAFTTQAQRDATIGAFFDQREIQVARLQAADFKSKVQVSDADVDAYYKAHSAAFQAPEELSIEYLVLDLDAVKRNIAVSDADLKSYYEQNKDRLGSKEERRASHILITLPPDASADQRAKARAKAEQILGELKKNPGEFAELARKESQDPGSAESGGQLDLVTRGAMVKPFEDALFALKTNGEISDVIETQFGYHIIKLDEIKPSTVPPLEEVRAKVEDEVRAQKATQEFAKAAETFTDLIYQQPDSLKPAADKLKLKIQTATDVTRSPAPGATGVLASRNFLTALFAPDTLERKHNTEAIDVGSNQLAAGRVAQYAPARTRPLAEVKDSIRELLVNERAAALAREEGLARLKAWQADTGATKFDAPVTVSRRDPGAQPAPVIEAALRVDPGKLPSLIGVDLAAAGYAVVRVNKEVPRPASSPDVATQERAQMTQSVAAAESAAYYDLLKDRLNAKILVAQPAALTGPQSVR